MTHNYCQDSRFQEQEATFMSHMYESQGGSQTQGSHPQSTCGLGNKSTLVQVKNDRDVNKRVNTLDLQLKV